MLTHRDLATLRAALLFWQEEMCPHGKEVMLPYFDSSAADPLTSNEIDELRHLLLPERARYASQRDDKGALARVDLFDSAEAAASGAPPATRVVTVLGALD